MKASDYVNTFVNNVEGLKQYAQKLEQQKDELLKALEEISKGEGAYSRDQLTHASNCIEHMIAIAQAAMAAIEKADK